MPQHNSSNNCILKLKGSALSFSCMFGLTACLTFGGSQIPASDAIEIADDCDLLRELHVSAFAPSGNSMMGLVVAESIRDKGVDLPHFDNALSRKNVWGNICLQFDRTFRGNSKWENLDKWPD